METIKIKTKVQESVEKEIEINTPYFGKYKGYTMEYFQRIGNDKKIMTLTVGPDYASISEGLTIDSQTSQDDYLKSVQISAAEFAEAFESAKENLFQKYLNF